MDNNWERIEQKGGQTADKERRVLLGVAALGQGSLKWKTREAARLSSMASTRSGVGSYCGYSSDQRKVGPYVYPRTDTLHHLGPYVYPRTENRYITSS